MTIVQETENRAKMRATPRPVAGTGRPKRLDRLQEILCLMEYLHLPVRDINFSRKEILVRPDKGAKDRIAMRPEALKRVGLAIAHQSWSLLYRVVVIGGIPYHSKWCAMAHPTLLTKDR